MMKMWNIYTREYYPAIKKERNNAFAVTWMQLEIVVVIEVSQKENDTHPISLICGI